MTEERVDTVAQGRVWTGIQAYERGLVDHLGGLHMAVGRVRARLGLDADADVALVSFPPPRSLGEELADALDSRLEVAWLSYLRLPDRLERIARQWLELEPGSPLLIPPFLVEIH